jgi:ABC-type polysaccharide/polyol phosphate export permease
VRGTLRSRITTITPTSRPRATESRYLSPTSTTLTVGATGRRNRALLANFFRREVDIRYLGSATGLAWALLHPLALLAIYYFVFTMVFRVGGFSGKSYLAFAAVALWPWLATQEAISRATVSLAGYTGLIRKVAFPHELVVYASVAATLALQFTGYLAVLIVLALFGEPVHFSGLLLAVPLWVATAIAITGIALCLSALQVYMRDVEHVLSPLLTIGMYAAPILYPLAMVPESVRPLVEANPFSWLVDRLRDALLDGAFALRWSDGAALFGALVVFFAGRWVFRRLSPYFEDFL